MNSNTTTRAKKINTIEKMGILRQAMEIVEMESKYKGAFTVERVLKVYEKLINKLS